MKLLRFNENTLQSSLKDFKDNDDLIKLIGFEPNKYSLTISNGTSYDFTLSFKENFLTDFLDLEEGIFSWCFGVISSYSQYETYVDDCELDYIDGYLNEDNLAKLKSLLYYLDIEFTEGEENNISYVFKTMGDDLIDMDEFIYAIGMEWENAVEYNVKESKNKLPFNINYSSFSSWDIDIDFSVEKIVAYIEKYKLDVDTIKDFLENIDFSEFSQEELENHYETNYNFDYKELNKVFEKEIDEVLEKIDIEAPKFEDPRQLKLFGEDDYEKLKKEKKYKFEYDFFKYLDIENIRYAKRAGGKLLAWFKSYPFQNIYMKDNDLKKYKKLKAEGIIHPKIEDEYEYLDSSTKYNL